MRWAVLGNLGPVKAGDLASGRIKQRAAAWLSGACGDGGQGQGAEGPDLQCGERGLLT